MKTLSRQTRIPISRHVRTESGDSVVGKDKGGIGPRLRELGGWEGGKDLGWSMEYLKEFRKRAGR